MFARHRHALEQLLQEEAAENFPHRTHDSSHSRSSGDIIHRRRRPQPNQTNRMNTFQPETHDAGRSDARESGTEPEEEEQDDRTSWRKSQRMPSGRKPTGDSHHRGTGWRSGGDQDHVGVFSQEEQREGHARVLDHEADDSIRPPRGRKGARLVLATMAATIDDEHREAATSSRRINESVLGEAARP